MKLYNSLIALMWTTASGKFSIAEVGEQTNFFYFELGKAARTQSATKYDAGAMQQLFAALDLAEAEGRVVYGARLGGINQDQVGVIVNMTGLKPVQAIPEEPIHYIGDRDAAWQAWFGDKLTVIRQPGEDPDHPRWRPSRRW